MAVIESWFTQERTQPVKVRYLDGNVFSMDNNGNLIGIEVLDNGEPASLSGTVSASVIRADGGTVAVQGTLSGNKCSVILPQACYAIPGAISIVIKLTTGSDIATIGAVVGVVYQSSTDSVVDPGSILPSISTLIAAIDAAVASIPLDYSDLNKLAHTVMTGGVANFKYKNLLVKINPKVGYYVPYNSGIETALANWQYYVVPSPGQYVISVGSGNTHVAFFDKTGAYISGANPTWQGNYSFSPPADCAYFTYSCPVADAQYMIVLSDTGIRSRDDSPVAEIINAELTISNMPKIVKPRKNLFNKYVVHSGGFIDYYSKGSFTANANYSFCPWFIPAKASTMYCPNGPCLIAEYDKDFNWLLVHNMTALANVQPFTTDEDCAFVRISCASVDTYQLEEGSASTAYSPFQMVFVGDDEAEATGRTIIVDANGGGNYTTISAACAAANDGDTIYIMDGVYYESVKINGLRVHLIGESREGTILKYLGTQYANPPLEMSNGSIENMTIWAITESGASGGGGYCLHCDNVASANGYLSCRNVKFQNDYYQVIGIGLQPNFILSFEDCEFIGQVYIHDCATDFESLTGQQIRFINCTISATAEPLGAIRMQSQERAGAYASALFQRCIIKNTGATTIVYMGLWQDSGLAKDGWLGSTDWHLDGLSALNNQSIVNAE